MLENSTIRKLRNSDWFPIDRTIVNVQSSVSSVHVRRSHNMTCEQRHLELSTPQSHPQQITWYVVFVVCRATKLLWAWYRIHVPSLTVTWSCLSLLEMLVCTRVQFWARFSCRISRVLMMLYRWLYGFGHRAESEELELENTKTACLSIPSGEEQTPTLLRSWERSSPHCNRDWR